MADVDENSVPYLSLIVVNGDSLNIVQETQGWSLEAGGYESLGTDKETYTCKLSDLDPASIWVTEGLADFTRDPGGKIHRWEICGLTSGRQALVRETSKDGPGEMINLFCIRFPDKQTARDAAAGLKALVMRAARAR